MPRPMGTPPAAPGPRVGAPLLVRQLDAQADGDRAGVPGAAVGRLHDPGAAAGDDGVALLAEPPRECPRLGVARVVARCARRAEDGDSLADVRELREAGAQL